MSLIPPNVEVACRLLDKNPSWADYDRSILRQAHMHRDEMSYWGEGPWYVRWELTQFVMRPIINTRYARSFRVLAGEEYWIFEVI